MQREGHKALKLPRWNNKFALALKFKSLILELLIWTFFAVSKLYLSLNVLLVDIFDRETCLLLERWTVKLRIYL